MHGALSRVARTEEAPAPRAARALAHNLGDAASLGAPLQPHSVPQPLVQIRAFRKRALSEGEPDVPILRMPHQRMHPPRRIRQTPHLGEFELRKEHAQYLVRQPRQPRACVAAARLLILALAPMREEVVLCRLSSREREALEGEALTLHPGCRAAMVVMQRHLARARAERVLPGRAWRASSWTASALDGPLSVLVVWPWARKFVSEGSS
mmetsp:Transcript_21697/g.48924  ORF Transcript_21697/g.48924 Transcript_21697/m.48924 type:complete len:209 (-) Transcript_21697:28-654(-)